MIELDEYKQRAIALSPVIDEISDALDIENLRVEVKELEEKSASPEFWDDMANSQKILQKLKQAQNKIQMVDKLRSRTEDVKVMIQMAIEENDDSFSEEIREELEALES